jgi:hypothetical protein
MGKPTKDGAVHELMPPPSIYVRTQCPQCVSVRGVEIFLTDKMKKMLKGEIAWI